MDPFRLNLFAATVPVYSSELYVLYPKNPTQPCPYGAGISGGSDKSKLIEPFGPIISWLALIFPHNQQL